MLAFRVIRCYNDLKPFIEKLSNFCDRLIVYEHLEAARLHIHALVHNCKPTTDTLKNWIKAVVGKVLPSDWSFITENVNDKFPIYMSKGKLSPSFVKDYTEQQIEEFRLLWVDRPPLKRQSKLTFVVKETVAERKQRQEDMVKEIIKRVEVSEDQTPAFIIGTIHRVVCIENRNMLGRYKVRDYYDTVISHVHKQTWVMHMERLCLYKI